ncbi:hypothetical protein [Collimonas humicola]|uniref:hypothetical protein n=1 Tax=Collimonas humicola TaxID=2825886 RepID=UPI001B8CF31F|nr:hypothetical protein [Collimonas humicola]
MKKFKAVLTTTAVLIISLISGCKDHVPESNTPPYYKLHGIVNDGKTVNEITLFNDRNNNLPELRFPPEIFVDVDTAGAHDSNPTLIRKGFANSAGIALAFNSKNKLEPLKNKHDDFVSLNFSASLGPENVQATEARLREIASSSIRTTTMTDWGLREYVTLAPKTDMLSQFDYVPLDDSIRSADGVRIWVGCLGGGDRSVLGSPAERTAAYACAGHFDIQGGLSVTFIFKSELLPHWREIYNEANRIAKTAIVSNS